MNKIFSSLIVILALFLFNACDHGQETAPSASGHAVLKGTIVAVAPNRSLPMDNMLVMIHGTNLTTTTGKDGNFTIKGLKPGHYKLITSSKLYHPRSHDITVTGDTTTVNIHLLPNNNQ